MDETVIYSPVPKRSKGRPKVDGEPKTWDIRLTPVDQVEVDFSSLDLSDFQILLVCKEGEPNGQPRLHYHMYGVTTRSDSYIDNLMNRLGRANAITKGNAVFSKRKAHNGTLGYVVKNGDVVLRHGIDDRFLTEIFKKSQDYRKEKEAERKKQSRSNENFLGNLMKEIEAKQLSDPAAITSCILQAYSASEKRFPSRSSVESAVMSILYKQKPRMVIQWYTPHFFSEY